MYVCILPQGASMSCALPSKQNLRAIPGHRYIRLNNEPFQFYIILLRFWIRVVEILGILWILGRCAVASVLLLGSSVAKGLGAESPDSRIQRGKFMLIEWKTHRHKHRSNNLQ